MTLQELVNHTVRTSIVTSAKLSSPRLLAFKIPRQADAQLRPIEAWHHFPREQFTPLAHPLT